MLSKFKVSNYLSFDEEQVLSMGAGKVRNNIERVYTEAGQKLLKFMAIYGSNASGKSNLVNAFSFAQAAITMGFPKGANSEYCRLRDENKNRPSIFEFTIIINGDEYIYGFELIISEGRFLKEYLMRVRTQTVKTIFLRDIELGTYTVDAYFKDVAINERLRIYAEDVKNDGTILFLRLMNQNKDSLYKEETEIGLFRKIYNWFRYDLSVNYPDKPITSYSYLMDSEAVDKIGALFAKFGTGVSKFDLAEVPFDKISAQIPKSILDKIAEELNEHKNNRKGDSEKPGPSIMIRSSDNSMFLIQLAGDELICRTLVFQHAHTDAVFSAEEESDGTVRLLDLIEILLSKAKNKVYIVDEINRRFHPLLTYAFVEQYLKVASERNIQLIVTTHESKIMDLDLLRKDEICFVDKNPDGKSTIFYLDSFNDRFDKKIAKAYLKGNYGAIPKFSFE